MDWSDRTLDQLEGADWGKPTYPSYVVTNAHRLRKVPLREFTPEDLRFMLGQQISLSILMPMALDVLEREPYLGGEMYPGALLTVALRVEPVFWREHQELWRRLDNVAGEVEDLARLLREDVLPAIERFRVAPWQSS